MAQSAPSDGRDVRADNQIGSRNDSVSYAPDAAQKSPSVRPSFIADLASTIESVIIPRLQLNHEANGRFSGSEDRASAVDDYMVRAFVERLMRGDSRDAMRHIETLLERGVSMDYILVDLLGPAACMMGEMWNEDSCNFVDVTLGMTRIQHMFRQLRIPFGEFDKPMNTKGRALLVPAPGEQHVFGLRVVEELLLREGWDIDCRLRASLNDILYIVRDEAYDFIGFSLSGERLLEPLASAIRLVRLNSRNRAIRIMVGGVYFVEQPEAGREIDADAVTLDARSAVTKANEWHEAMRSAQ